MFRNCNLLVFGFSLSLSDTKVRPWNWKTLNQLMMTSINQGIALNHIQKISHSVSTIIGIDSSVCWIIQERYLICQSHGRRSLHFGTQMLWRQVAQVSKPQNRKEWELKYFFSAVDELQVWVFHKLLIWFPGIFKTSHLFLGLARYEPKNGKWSATEWFMWRKIPWCWCRGQRSKLAGSMTGCCLVP